MTDEAPATNDNAQPPAPKLRVKLLISRNGQFIVQPFTPGQEQPARIIMPLNIAGDPRYFVKNGEIVRPFITIEFKHRKTMDVSGIDVAIYAEVASKEFDPSDMQPIAVRSLDKDFEELNAVLQQ